MDTAAGTRRDIPASLNSEALNSRQQIHVHAGNCSECQAPCICPCMQKLVLVCTCNNRCMYPAPNSQAEIEPESAKTPEVVHNSQVVLAVVPEAALCACCTTSCMCG
jgi:hypothetical protein